MTRVEGARASDRLTDAAVAAFAERGFAATTTRDIAARAGMSPAAVYIHHRSKEELLFALSMQGHQGTLALVTGAVSGAQNPPERLRAVVCAFTRWHAEHHTRARVVQYELHALTPDHFEQVAAYRRQIDALVRTLLDDGVEAGDFDVTDVRGTTLAILSMGIDVARWFTDDGPRSPEEVADLYADLALRMAGATGGTLTPTR